MTKSCFDNLQIICRIYFSHMVLAADLDLRPGLDLTWRDILAGDVGVCRPDTAVARSDDLSNSCTIRSACITAWSSSVSAIC